MALAGTPLTTAMASTAQCEAGMSRLGGSSLVGQPCWRCSRAAPRRRRQRLLQQPRAALLDPPPFDPSKLRVEYLPGVREQRLGAGRRYTLTHNDVTGSLQLSIGCEYNRRQLDGWYTRILRDEILAEWRETAPPMALPTASSSSDGDYEPSSSGSDSGSAAENRQRSPPQPSLHVFCHVSGEELWPAPPQLRSFIFQREMRLVLDTIAHAERAALAVTPSLAAAPVYVHLHSDIPALDRVVEWGQLGNRASWRTSTSSIMRSLLSSVMGTMDEADNSATDGSNGSWSPASFSAGTSNLASWDGGCGGGGEGGEGVAAAGWGAGSWDADDRPQQRQQQREAPPAVAAAVAPPDLGSSDGSRGGDGVGGEQQGGAAAASQNAAACSGGSGGASGLGVTANGAVSLAAQQAAESSSSWLGATAVVADGRRRMSAADVVPAAISSRQR